jgi:hypothetical protein
VCRMETRDVVAAMGVDSVITHIYIYILCLLS